MRAGDVPKFKMQGVEQCWHCKHRDGSGLHQIIRSQAGCLFCKYSTRKLYYSKCMDCLSADTRINFEKEVFTDS